MNTQQDQKTGENIHIYMNSEQVKEKILKDATPYEKYIITINETLQVENQRLRKELAESEKRSEEFLEEVGKNETSMFHMKGFLKNLALIGRLCDKNSKEYEKINKDITKTISNFQIKAYRHFRYLQALMVITVGIVYGTQFYSIYQSIMLSVYFMVIYAYQESTLSKVRIPNISTYLSEINTIQLELLDLKKGQDFLIDYIELC
jgi:hypothetical protein